LRILIPVKDKPSEQISNHERRGAMTGAKVWNGSISLRDSYKFISGHTTQIRAVIKTFAPELNLGQRTYLPPTSYMDDNLRKKMTLHLRPEMKTVFVPMDIGGSLQLICDERAVAIALPLPIK
jgi:hypothetical protein